jgi:L-threonylcarbamoyladenylate synthase
VTVLDCHDPQWWGPALDEAVHALRRGELVVIPTDTGYGLAADAFDPRAVAAIGPAKGRAEHVPVGVLIGDPRTLDGLCTDVPEEARALVAAFWPGALTLVCRAQPSLAWDLGEAEGTVAVRMPDHPAALALLRRTGPLAVTGVRGRDGSTAPSVAQAQEVHGSHARWFVDAGPVGDTWSTVVDATGDRLRVLREGAVGVAEIGAVARLHDDDDEDVPGDDEAPSDEDGAVR